MNRVTQRYVVNVAAIFAVVAAILLLIGEGRTAKAADAKLRLALLPIPDVLPVHVAEAKGYFAEAGIVVEPLPVGSAVERDQLLQAGRIDGMINEISGAALFNRDKVQLQIVSYARIPTEDAPLFRILVAPASKVQTVADLAGVPIGVSKNTIIEYITDRLLQAGGLTGEAIVTRSVPVLPERLQLLLSGQLEAATLPDPLAFSALQAGAREMVSDTVLPELSASVVSFSAEAIEKSPETIKKFMIAWDKAVADINADPQIFQELMLEKIRVPKNIQQTFKIPPFPRGKLPTKTQWDDVQTWLVNKKLLEKEGSYENSVNASFLAHQ